MTKKSWQQPAQSLSRPLRRSHAALWSLERHSQRAHPQRTHPYRRLLPGGITPARRSFLKSNPVETKHIFEELQRAALARPDIAFSLYQNDLEVYQLPIAKLSQRIVHLFGDKYKEQLIPCKEATQSLQLQGYIGKPALAKKTRGEQFFFVN